MEAPEEKAAGRPHKVVVRLQEAQRRVESLRVARQPEAPLVVAPQQAVRLAALPEAPLVELSVAALRQAGLQAALRVAPLVELSVAARRLVVQPVAPR